MAWKKYIQDYKLYLKIESGLSETSVVNYMYDVNRFVHFIENEGITAGPLEVDENIIQEFIYKVASELNPRSRARLISGLKSFFNYLVFEDYRKSSPMELIEVPKIGRKLPDTLSLKEIDALIAAIDLSSPEGERNRAMLETLYGCGLRVSELTGLRMSDLFFEEGFIKVTGKGNKQRFVPVGGATQK